MKTTEDVDKLISALRATLGKLELALSAISEAIACTGEDGRLQWGNSRLAQLVNRPYVEILGARLTDLLPLEQRGQRVAPEVHPMNLIFSSPSSHAGIYEFRQGDRRLYLDISGERLALGNQERNAVFVIRDITERWQAEEEKTKRAEALAASNKELEAFSYSVSHDLRAPLRAISGFSNVLMEDYTGKLDADGLRYLQLIQKNTQNMGQLIDDLLAFSRLGRQAITLSHISMNELAQTVFDELKPLNRTLQFHLSPLPPALGDPALIREVFVNLLSNAIKFTKYKENALIAIGFQGEGDQTFYYVKDNGVGFDMQHRDKLFGVFQRLHAANEFEGTGVGLALVQRIIGRHGGRVWAEGKVNEGAAIYFTLPRAEDDQGGF